MLLAIRRHTLDDSPDVKRRRRTVAATDESDDAKHARYHQYLTPVRYQYIHTCNTSHLTLFQLQSATFCPAVLAFRVVIGCSYDSFVSQLIGLRGFVPVMLSP